MAFTVDFIPLTTIEEAQDGMSFKLINASTYGTGDAAKVTKYEIDIVHINEDEISIDYDTITLVVGVDVVDIAAFLSAAGLVIDIADLTIDAVAAGEVFPDGYYEITVTFTPDDTVTKAYKNCQAFLAKYRAMKRTMPAAILTWPITEAVREKNYDIFALGLYLDAAEYAADLARKTHFRKFIGVIKNILDFYSIPSPW